MKPRPREGRFSGILLRLAVVVALAVVAYVLR